MPARCNPEHFSYFASMIFSYGCTPHNWEYIFKTLQKNKMDFLPSVGPGYEDTAVRPWNRIHKKDRKNGDYYAEYFQKAISLRPKVSQTICSLDEVASVFFNLFNPYRRFLGSSPSAISGEKTKKVARKTLETPPSENMVDHVNPYS